jgi:hypothetical protein
VPRKIETEYAPKPMPNRDFDWLASHEGWGLGEPIGYGATEAEAIEDLKEKMDER